MRLEVTYEAERVAPGLRQPRGGEQRGARVAGCDRVERVEEQVGVRDAEHGKHVLGRDPDGGRAPVGVHARVRDELLERSERVAEGPGGVAREQHDRVRRDRDLLGLGDAGHDGGELLDGRPGEVEAMAAVDDRRQDL